MATTIELEQQRAREVAEEYRRRGYDVIEKPTVDQLPDFLAGYQPDLLARRENKTVAVEVRARSSLGKTPQISHLARLFREKPGWDFELVVVGERGKLDLPEDAHLLGKDEASQRITASDSLLDAGHAEAALILVWSVLEATIRMLLEEEDPSLSFLDSEHVLSYAVVYGVLSRNDYGPLMKARKYRNAVANGFQISDVELSAEYSVIKGIIQHILQSETEA